MSKYYRKSGITELPGVEMTKAKLRKFLKTVDTVPRNILEDEAEQTEMEAKQETPYKEGTLEDSVYVNVSRDKRRPGFRLGARAHDPNTGFDYAYIQHESPDFNHPIKGKAYYIEDPFVRAVKRIIARLKNEVKY